MFSVYISLLSCMLSFGWFPGAWNLYTNVSEHCLFHLLMSIWAPTWKKNIFTRLSWCYKTHTVANRTCPQVISINRALYEYEACDMIYNQRDGIKTQKCSRKKLHFGEMTAQYKQIFRIIILKIFGQLIQSAWWSFNKLSYF